MAGLDGFQGHFDMLLDDERNSKYAKLYIEQPQIS